MFVFFVGNFGFKRVFNFVVVQILFLNYFYVWVLNLWGHFNFQFTDNTAFFFILLINFPFLHDSLLFAARVLLYRVLMLLVVLIFNLLYLFLIIELRLFILFTYLFKRFFLEKICRWIAILASFLLLLCGFERLINIKEMLSKCRFVIFLTLFRWYHTIIHFSFSHEI